MTEMNTCTAAEALAAKNGRKATTVRKLTAAEVFGSIWEKYTSNDDRRRLEKTAKALKKIKTHYIKRTNKILISRAHTPGGYDAAWICDGYSAVVLPYCAYRSAFPDLPEVEPNCTMIRYPNSGTWEYGGGYPTVCTAAKTFTDAYFSAIPCRATLEAIPDYLAEKLDAYAIMCEDQEGNAFPFSGRVFALAEALQLEPLCFTKSYRLKGEPSVKATHLVTNPYWPVWMFACGIRYNGED